MASATQLQYVVCITNRGNEASVIKGKLYRLVEPHPNDASTDIRIIDEEGEDYPYPRDWFEPVDVTERAVAALEAA